MPKIKKTSSAEKADKIRSAISCQRTYLHLDINETCKKAGFTIGTYYSRYRNPETFRLYEIEALDKVLHFTDEQRRCFI